MISILTTYQGFLCPQFKRSDFMLFFHYFFTIAWMITLGTLHKNVSDRLKNVHPKSNLSEYFFFSNDVWNANSDSPKRALSATFCPHKAELLKSETMRDQSNQCDRGSGSCNTGFFLTDRAFFYNKQVQENLRMF